MPNVTDEANDRDPFNIRLTCITKSNAFADNILFGEPLPCKGLIDKNGGRRVDIVSLVKKTTAEEWYFQGFEVIGGDGPDFLVWIGCVLEGIAAFDGERTVAIVAAKRKD